VHFLPTAKGEAPIALPVEDLSRPQVSSIAEAARQANRIADGPLDTAPADRGNPQRRRVRRRSYARMMNRSFPESSAKPL